MILCLKTAWTFLGRWQLDFWLPPIQCLNFLWLFLGGIRPARSTNDLARCQRCQTFCTASNNSLALAASLSLWCGLKHFGCAQDPRAWLCFFWSHPKVLPQGSRPCFWWGSLFPSHARSLSKSPEHPAVPSSGWVSLSWTVGPIPTQGSSRQKKGWIVWSW